MSSKTVGFTTEDTMKCDLVIGSEGYVKAISDYLNTNAGPQYLILPNLDGYQAEANTTIEEATIFLNDHVKNNLLPEAYKIALLYFYIQSTPIVNQPASLENALLRFNAITAAESFAIKLGWKILCSRPGVNFVGPGWVWEGHEKK